MDGNGCDENFQVVELLTKDGDSVQVSLWIRQLDTDGPCLVVAEPVNCKNVVVRFIIYSKYMYGQAIT